MAVAHSTERPGGFQADLSQLEKSLEADILSSSRPLAARNSARPSKGNVVLSASPEAVLTFGAIASACAVWLVKVLPY